MACGLSAQKMEFEKAEQASSARDFAQALKHYDQIIDQYVKSDLALRSAESAGRIAYYEAKDFKRALRYFKHIVLYSPSSAARTEAQKLAAEINYEHLQDYNQAIIEFSRLLNLPHTRREEVLYRLSVARSYYYLKRFYQALVEVDGLLESSSSGEELNKKDLFDALELKANILVQSKKLDEAVEVLTKLIDDHPDQSKERQIGLVLAVCYEEKKDFEKAIRTLESIKSTYPSPKFIEGRIKSLKERQSYLPGARGLKK